jgi:tetratricopeptide (TPR) repeat protein
MPSERIQKAINAIRAAEGASIRLDLSHAFREEDDAKCIAEGIKAARFRLILYLGENAIGEAGVKFLAEAIKEAQAPINLELSKNDIGDVGVEFLAEGIKEARFPFSLWLEGNKIGDAGAKFISEGIKEARVPLTLELRYNNIGEAGAKFLSEGIRETRFPLTLGLYSNNIGDAGAKFLPEGIKEARVPLTLNLMRNKIGDAGAKFLSEAIQKARVPLKLLPRDEVKVQDNFIIDAGENPSEFFAKLKFNPFNLLGLRPILLQMPVVQELLGLNYPKDIALIIQDYDPDLDYLAWKAVAAIRAVEGASRDNNYASIDYDLLSAVYSTALVGSVASVLEEKAMEDDTQEARREAPVVISVEAAQSLNAKAIAYEKAGDLVRALDCKERALKMYQEVYNEAHPEVARTLNAIGVLHEKLGNAEKSLDYKESALKMRRALHEGAHLDIAGSLNNVGIAYELLGYIRLGIYYKEKGLKMMHSLYPDNHPAVVACLNNVALGYQKLRELEDYSNYKGRADDVRQAIAGQNQERASVFKGQGTLGHTDNNYPEYYNSGIDRVLELRLAGVTNAVLLKSQYFGEELGKVVSRLACDVSSILSGGSVQTVLAPVNLYNRHWLGLLFRNLGTMVDVTYMDPEQATMLPGLRSGLENGLSLSGYKSQLKKARLTPQSYNNCGYEVIENFMYYLTGSRATQVGAMYVHSLLVENSLLDPNVYGLKLEENTKLIKFLSNADTIGIQEMTLFVEQGNENNHKKAVPGNSLAKLKTDLHRASVLFKTLDFVVDSARVVKEPSILSFKKLALDYAYLQAMVSGVNSYSAMIAVAETLYQLQLGEYQQAFNIASSTMIAMALPFILAMANRPYLGVAYGVWMTASTAYCAITNAYSFATEFRSNDAALRSAKAYKDLSELLASSPLQSLYDFEAKVKECKLQVNDLLFEKEKSIIQAKVKDEFGQKVFNYVYLPELIEKYVLLNDVIRGKLAEEEAQSLKSKPIAISYGALEYDRCMILEDSARLEGAAEHYYCCNIAGQILDHVVLTSSGSLEVLESL